MSSMEIPVRCPLDEEFGYKARRELALCLDPIAPMGNDWRLLMDEMGFAYRFKHYLEQEKSPTIKLLEVWTQFVGGKASLSLLKDHISKMEPQRSDAVDVVRKHMKLSETRINQNLEYNDDTFCSGSPLDTTCLFAAHCSLRTTNSSTNSTAHNSTSSFASVSSSVSNNHQEETSDCISPVSIIMPEAPPNSSTPSVMTNATPGGYEATLQEPSSFTYPSPTNSLRGVPNSYATDPSSLPTPNTMLNDHSSPHTPVRFVSGGEKLVLTTVDNGTEPLGLNMSPSSSPRPRCSPNVSPRATRSRGSSSSPTAFKQVDPIEETIALQRHDSSEDDFTVTISAQEEIQNYDIYLSASPDDEDQQFAEMMYQKLKKQKFTVFFSGHHNIIGRALADDVVQMIKDKCTKTLIILSESYNRDEKCTYEARMAHMKSLDARNHVLVPVMYKKCKAPDFISHLYYLDYERYKNRPAEDIQEYFWNRLYRSLRYTPQNDSSSTSSNKKKQSGYTKKLTTVITTRPKFPFFTR